MTPNGLGTTLFAALPPFEAGMYRILYAAGLALVFWWITTFGDDLREAYSDLRTFFQVLTFRYRAWQTIRILENMRNL